MVAEILIAVAWKSMVVAAAIVALLFAMRRQVPANRVAVGASGFLLLLMLPVIAAIAALQPVPAIEVAAPAGIEFLHIANATSPMPIASTLLIEQADVAPALLTLNQLLAIAWAFGVAIVVLRLAVGLAALDRWTRQATPVTGAQWRAILSRCALPNGVRVLTSEAISSPLSWGWRRPVILIDRGTLARTAEAEAVIAHEAAHVLRGDWPRMIAARLVVALFWFNPFVWLLEQFYLQGIEESADAQATDRVEPAHYAQILLNAARGASVPVGANSMASGSLAKRIQRILRGSEGSRWDRTWRAGALAGSALAAGLVAIVQIASPPASASTPLAAAPTAALPARALIAPVTPSAPVVASPVEPAATVMAAPVGPKVNAAVSVPIAAVMAVAAAQSAGLQDPQSRAEIDRIRQAAQSLEEQAGVITRESRALAARALEDAKVAMARARTEMLRGADEMDRGAVQMKQGAATMREEARKLRDPAYRAKVIAEAKAEKARGVRTDVPTDQELIDAIPKLEHGADKMDAGRVKMIEGAAKMRRSAQDQ